MIRRPRTVAEAFASVVARCIDEVRREAHDTEAAVADQQRRIDNLVRRSASWPPFPPSHERQADDGRSFGARGR
jgi:hypothetical protein